MSTSVVSVLRAIGNVLALVAGGLATANTFPTLTPVLSAVSTGLLGWLNLERPKGKEKAS